MVHDGGAWEQLARLLLLCRGLHSHTHASNLTDCYKGAGCAIRESLKGSCAVLPQAAEDLDTGTPLPPALLAMVLQHVNLQQRLDACARVSTAWHAAAVLSTRRIELPACTQRKCSALGPWLTTTAHGVEAVSIAARYDSRILAADAWINTPESAWRMPELQLPYNQLSSLTSLSLKLLKCPLTAAAAAGTSSAQQATFPPPGVGINSSSSSSAKTPAASSRGAKTLTASLATLTALKELSVTDCVISLEGMPALTALERLELLQGWGAPHASHRPAAGAAGQPGYASAAAAPVGLSLLCDDVAGTALPHLTRLTHLTLAGKVARSACVWLEKGSNRGRVLCVCGWGGGAANKTGRHARNTETLGAPHIPGPDGTVADCDRKFLPAWAACCSQRDCRQLLQRGRLSKPPPP